MTVSWPGMYRLITVTLVVIVGVAMVLSGFGLVGFSPLGIGTTVIVAIVATVATSSLGALVTRQTLHLESSVITGLLIALIVPPTLEIRDILGASVTGAIAGASKWLVAPRGRHILNPAATGVLLASLFGLTVGFWWVATPWLAPLIVLGGAVVAYRSGHGFAASWFIAIGLVALVARLLLAGEPVGETLWLVSTSYPVVFMGLFMVSEPLTMATRRGDQFVVALIMALLVALPFSVPLGPVEIFSSPELALVLGNLAAAALTAVRGVNRSTTVRLHETNQLSDTVVEYRFRGDRRLGIEPGQWVELSLPHPRPDSRGTRRVMSVSRLAPEDQEGTWSFAITTRLAPSGSSWKRALSTLQPGETARVTTVGGDFMPPHAIVGHLVMVAGGIGVTPFAAQLFDTRDRELGIEATLIVVSSRAGEDIYPELSEVRGVRRVVVNDVPDIATALPEDIDAVSWTGVSGSPEFVARARRELERAGVRRVHTDRFIGY